LDALPRVVKIQGFFSRIHKLREASFLPPIPLLDWYTAIDKVLLRLPKASFSVIVLSI